MPFWLEWAFWLSPLSYGEIGLALNEFLAPRWQKVSVILKSANYGIRLAIAEFPNMFKDCFKILWPINYFMKEHLLNTTESKPTDPRVYFF